MMGAPREFVDDFDIAVIGLACRFPGAASPDEFWANLAAGVESIRPLTDDELRQSGVPASEFLHPDYVRAASVLEDVDRFDASFFGYSPKEAELLDPQIRVLLECAWEAFEHAGHDPLRTTVPVGVFAASSFNTYLLTSLRDRFRPNRFVLSDGSMQQFLANAQDFITTRVSYKLNLKGPSINVQTACSGSLVAVHLACQSLRSDECRMALAAAVSIFLPQRVGYLHRDGLILSPDGHCRPFDEQAGGTVFGRGAGAILLKRLSDALADGDQVYAVIKGSAVNNDGHAKVGYTAPGVAGQASVIAEAMANAGVSPDTISYVEAHGTATRQGDPIEVAGLTRAYRASTSRTQFCALGAVKGNIGHLDAAAGIAGLIKTILALNHRMLPPTLHYTRPNPSIDFTPTPFYVNARLTPWTVPPGIPRRAGVSAFGMGGTNAHVIVEEARGGEGEGREAGGRAVVVCVSAKSEAALGAVAAGMAGAVERAGDAGLEAVSATANLGRAQWEQRAAVAGGTARAVAAGLRAVGAGRAPERGARGGVRGGERVRVGWLFTGQGAQYAGMGRRLYETEAVFRETLEACDAALRSVLVVPLLDVLYGAAGARLEETAYAQPALMAVEWALAAQWRAWGVEPAVVLGHSVGELAAACTAGVLGWEDGLRLVAARGRLMQALPAGGGMAAVLGPEAAVQALAEAHGVTVSAVNGPAAVVVGGPVEAVGALCAAATAAGWSTQRLAVSHAFHTAAMAPMVAGLGAAAARMSYQAAQMPVVSTVTGRVAGAELGTAAYWERQAQAPVQFAAGLETLTGLCEVVVEVGPHPVLVGLGRRHVGGAERVWGASLERGQPDDVVLRGTLGALWTRGVAVDWSRVHTPRPRRVALPTYPFQRARFWIDTPLPSMTLNPSAPTTRSADRTPVRDASLAPDVYGVDWVAAPLPAPDRDHNDASPLPSADAICAPLQAIRAALAETEALHVYERLEPEFDRLCAAYVYRALAALGAPLRAGERWTSSDLVTRLRIVPSHRRLVDRLLEILREDGILARRGSVWTVLDHRPAADPAALQRTLDASHEVCRAELALLRRCGGALGEVLRGDVDPLRLLFPDGASADLVGVYSQAPSARVHNALIATAIAEEVARRTGRVRILEVGAGSGATTAAVLAALPADRVDYRFTDVSAFFVAEARHRFRDLPAIVPQILDIERDPAAQGLGGQRFDIVVAANVLHATRDLEESLDHVATLLAPGGLLLAWEHTRAERWIDLVFGLTEGWWRFRDTRLRPDHPLLAAPAWTALLRTHGFPDAVALVDSRADYDSPHALLCARRSPAAMGAADRAGEWLVLGDPGGLGRRLAAALERRRLACRVVDAQQSVHLGRQVTHVVDLRALDLEAADALTPAALERAQAAAGSALASLVRSAAGHMGARPRIWLVTRGAQMLAEDAGQSASTRAQASIWGWGRVVRLEHPDLWGGLIDLDLRSDADDASRIIDEVLAHSPDDQVAYRTGGRFAAKLIARSALPVRPFEVSPHALYLMTGGLGAVALHVASWLAERGARHLVLIGRSGLPRDAPGEETARAVRALERRGVSVHVRPADAGDESAMTAVLAGLQSTGLPIRGVVHAAGVLTPGAIADLTDDDIASVLHPKVAGAEVLHRLTASAELDFFILFSTAAAVIGSKGLAHYAAANAFLDGLAHDRRRLGLPALVIDWGRWDVVSRMMSASGHRWLEAEGMRAFGPRQGLRALDGLLSARETQAAVLAAEPRFFAGLAGMRDGYFARVLPVADAASIPPAAPSDAQSPGDVRAEALDDGRQPYLRRLVAAVIGTPAETLDVEAPINTLGMDSIMALHLKNRIEADLGVAVSVVHFLSGDSVAQLARRLADAQAPATDQSAPPARSGPSAGTDASGVTETDPDRLSDAEVDEALARLLSGGTR